MQKAHLVQFAVTMYNVQCCPPHFLTFSAKHPFAALQPYLLHSCKLNNAKTELEKKGAME